MIIDPSIPEREVDPTTPEGWAEVKRRAQKSKEYMRRMRDLAYSGDPNDEPSGKLTQPNEMDLHRDRKSDD
jgi:hypothetical protein